MTIKTQVLELLRSEPAKRIRFTAPTRTGKITINRTVFKTVADAIDAGKIKITPTTTFAAGVGGTYSPGAVPGGPSGELQVQPLRGRIELGLALHECTHAYFDLAKSSVRATEEEALCYVVNALYFRMTGLARSRWDGEPHKTAGVVADLILREYQRGRVPVPDVDTSAWQSLVFAVGLHPVYIDQTAGIVRWLPFMPSDAYTNDG